ncbi:MAG: DeoR/GlpR family DNA-binding transcription regulator [Atopobiaceae bacterium]|jgi:DeoR family fructose operon transcriptional repressor|nr:DeoR/GlpR family DNA-binding transcription regulator [Atopobiaceae bacterium]
MSKTTAAPGARKAFAEERRASIVDTLEASSTISVPEICERFGVSAVTARGDLDALEKAGRLRRTHGGAVPLSRTVTVSFQDQRLNVNAGAKRAIAREAARLVRDGDSVFVDTGTTCLEFVRNLAPKSEVMVVTCDLTIANLIDEALPSVNVTLLGGELRKGHRYTTGPVAVNAIGMLFLDAAFVCPYSYVPGMGFMTNFAPMVELKQAMMAHAKRRVALMDSGKVGRSAFLRFAGMGDFDTLVCEEDPEGVLAGAVRKGGAGLDLVLAGSAQV